MTASWPQPAEHRQQTNQPMTTIFATLPEPVKGTILAPTPLRIWRMSVLNFRWPIDLALTVARHGWVQLAPWRWDSEASRLARTERMGIAAVP